MRLQPQYDSMSDVPAGFEGAYSENEGKAVFSGGEFEFETQSRYEELHTAKKKAFDDYHEANNRLKSFEGIDPAKYKSMADELEIANARLKNGGADEKTINELVTNRTNRETKSLQAMIDQLTGERDELLSFKLESEKTSLLKNAIGDGITEKAIGDAMRLIGPEIIRNADGTYTSKDGRSVEQVVSQAIEERPYWKKTSVAGHGSGGSGGAGSLTKIQQFKSLEEKVRSGDASSAEVKKLKLLAAEITADRKAG